MAEAGQHSIESPLLVQIPHVPPVVTMTILVFLVLIIATSIMARRLKMVPQGLQNFFEFIFSFWWEIGEGMMGHEIKRFFPLFISFFVYILFANLMGLIPGFMSPTSSLNTTVALSLIVFFSTHYFGIRKKGLGRYLKHFLGEPLWLSPLMLPIHVIGELVRPVSLACRLFGNILAKEIVLSVLILLILIFIPSPSLIAKTLAIFPLLLRPLIIVLGTLVSLVQASVFTILAMIYIGSAVTEEHGH